MNRRKHKTKDLSMSTAEAPKQDKKKDDADDGVLDFPNLKKKEDLPKYSSPVFADRRIPDNRLVKVTT